MNLADFVFALVTDPQEDLLQSRVGVRPLPSPRPRQGHKDSHPGALLPVFITRPCPQEWLCLVSYLLLGGVGGQTAAL